MRRNGFVVMARLIGLVKPLTGFMVLAVLMGLAGHLCATFITICGACAALSILGFETVGGLGKLFALMLVFAFLRGILRYGEQACNHFIAFKLLALIRDKVFHALRKLCPAKLEGRDKGDLIAVITSDIELLEVFYAHTISPSVIALLFTVIMCVFIGSFHPWMGLLAICSYLAVGILTPLFVSRADGGDGMAFRAGAGELSSFVLDSLRGLPEILQYGQGEQRLTQMNAQTDALLRDEARMKHRAGCSMAVTSAVILFFDMAMLCTGAILCQSGRVDYAGVLIPVVALFSSFGPVTALANLGSTLQNTFAAGNRVLDILDETPVAEEIQDGIAVGFDGAEAEHVTFSYPQKTLQSSPEQGKSAGRSETILDGLSLSFAPGKITGIIGRSGSGKSTLLKLLMRFWKTDSGRICISGEDVEHISTAVLRDMESLVTQETHLFHDSIKNNLKIARPDATDGEIEAACKKASVHDFIMGLPRGYDTPVGELGSTLSGGERQRLGLARAFLHDAPFLLLDEPTSNLDSLNEAVILKSLCEEREGRTVALVSHRQSTMRIADMVYFIENGRMS